MTRRRNPRPPSLPAVLPQTLLEQEAVDFAREHIRFVRDGKLKMYGAPGMWFDRGESRRSCRLAMRDWAMRDATNLMMAVGFARAGYQLSLEMLRELILEYQNRRPRVEMPTYLEAFAMDLTRGIDFPKRPGRPWADDEARDCILAVIVAKVIRQFGLKPNRNPASRHPSACSVVTAALALEGMATTEDSTVDIWKNMIRIVGKDGILSMA